MSIPDGVDAYVYYRQFENGLMNLISVAGVPLISVGTMSLFDPDAVENTTTNTTSNTTTTNTTSNTTTTNTTTNTTTPDNSTTNSN